MEVVFSYSRAQAIEDGVLIDAGVLAYEAGFRYSVALTAAAVESVRSGSGVLSLAGRAGEAVGCAERSAGQCPPPEQLSGCVFRPGAE
jgi:hypothetical protein